MKSDQNRTELFRARVYNAGAIVAAGVAVERLTISHGIGPLEASRFRFAVEELCAERISTGFAADEQPELRLVLELRPGEIAVTIEDAGSPIDAAAVAAGAKGWLAHLLERRFADSLRASFEGRAGNRCEMVKSLGDSARASLSDSGAGGSSTRAEIEADAGAPQPDNLEAAKSIQYRNMA
ncbi:MAG TPA: hypothetical protein VJN94_07430, partial [Candidatus Binataceae bacterium]|nr:hypothetical protein [Candidatus Binataceae bacterium]